MTSCDCLAAVKASPSLRELRPAAPGQDASDKDIACSSASTCRAGPGEMMLSAVSKRICGFRSRRSPRPRRRRSISASRRPRPRGYRAIQAERPRADAAVPGLPTAGSVGECSEVTQMPQLKGQRWPRRPGQFHRLRLAVRVGCLHPLPLIRDLTLPPHPVPGIGRKRRRCGWPSSRAHNHRRTRDLWDWHAPADPAQAGAPWPAVRCRARQPVTDRSSRTS